MANCIRRLRHFRVLEEGDTKSLVLVSGEVCGIHEIHGRNTTSMSEQYQGQAREQDDNPTQQAQYDLFPDQHQFGDQGSAERYSNLGPHGQYEEPEGDPDDYGPQDQFADVDGQDPYTNLYDEDPGSTPAGEDIEHPYEELYGLEEPLARPGDVSREGSETDRYGTRGSQDQYGYQK